MVSKELLTEEQAVSVNTSDIARFFETVLGERVANSMNVMREVPFTLALPAHLIYSDVDKDSGEKVLVQGVIDCLLDEGDGFVVIDFKTDSLKNKCIDEIVQRYQVQLDLYALAVETILRKPVKEKYLYLFSIGQEVRLGARS